MRERTDQLRKAGPAAVRASPAAAFLARRGRGLLIALVAAAFMTAVGALGSYSMPLPVRAAYWFSLMLIGAACGEVASTLVERGGWMEEHPFLRGLAIAAGLTVPVTVIVWAMTTFVFEGSRPSLPRLLWLAAPTFLITSAMTALNYATERRPRETHAAPEGGAPPRFLDRLPAKLRGAAVFAVEAEDHYLRLHTSKGQDLILMRLADAVTELEGVEGAQTHRSWWVARSAVADARRGDGRATLTLQDGAEVPVSRTYAKALREAGWF